MMGGPRKKNIMIETITQIDAINKSLNFFFFFFVKALKFPF